MDTPNRHANNSHAIRQADMNKPEKRFIVLVGYGKTNVLRTYQNEDTFPLSTHDEAIHMAKEMCSRNIDSYVLEVQEKIVAVPATPKICVYTGE